MYKWDTPHGWLWEKAQSWSKEEMYSVIVALSDHLDADTIQDVFQSEMEQDGYFDPERSEHGHG